MSYLFFSAVLLIGFMLYKGYGAKKKLAQNVQNEYHFIVRNLGAWSRCKSDVQLTRIALDCMDQYLLWEKRVMLYKSGAAEYTVDEVATVQEWRQIIDNNERLILDWKNTDALADRARFLQDCFVELREIRSGGF